MGRKEPNTQRAILYRVGMMQVDIGGLDDAGGGHWRLDEAVDHDEDGCRRDQMMRVGTRMRVGTGASLVQAHDMGKLSLQELITLACTLIIAGSETTTSFLSTGILHLIQSPGQFLTIKQRPELVPNFVEELLMVRHLLGSTLRMSNYRVYEFHQEVSLFPRSTPPIVILASSCGRRPREDGDANRDRILGPTFSQFAPSCASASTGMASFTIRRTVAAPR
jgi:hypothetical protein